jgi:hypothetical protein
MGDIPQELQKALFGSGAGWWACAASIANLLAPICLLVGIIGDAINRTPGLEPINWFIMAAALWVAGLSAWHIAYTAAKEEYKK